MQNNDSLGQFEKLSSQLLGYSNLSKIDLKLLKGIFGEDYNYDGDKENKIGK